MYDKGRLVGKPKQRNMSFPAAKPGFLRRRRQFAETARGLARRAPRHAVYMGI